MKNTASRAGQSGFTLIELSIVLVIIGLLVGGVLEGQDLIRAAQIRSTISQFEQFDAAVNTFRTKYNNLPGDVVSGTNFFAASDVPGSTPANCSKAVAGNGTLDDCTDVIPLRSTLSGEPAAFWRQLYVANLIPNTITDTSLIGGSAAVSAPTNANIPLAFPASKLGGSFIVAFTGGTALVEPGMAGSNLYRLSGISTFTAGAPTFANTLSPLQAFQIDSKKDDGNPNTGVVQATDATANFNIATDTFAHAANACVCANGDANCTATVYNTTPANNVQNNSLCQLMVRTSF